MDQLNIQGLTLTSLKKIIHPEGDILHGIKKSDQGFLGFGEAYFSKIKFGKIKGWNRHSKMTLNFIVPYGEVLFVIYDDRENSKTRGSFYEIILSPDNYQRLTISPLLYVAFKGMKPGLNLILNIADMEHDPKEIEKIDITRFNYDWNNK